VSWFGNKIGHYGKTNLVKVNGTPNSQPYGEGIVVMRLCHFWTRVKLPTERQTKDVLRQKISMYWNDPQGSLIYLQLSMCRTFLVNV
jgi:hypothetical protein